MIIPDDGPRDAKLVVIGEMDAVHETARNRHLVGPSGQLWERWLHEVGLTRAQCYVTNVVPYMHNRGAKIELVPRSEVEYWVTQLRARLEALADPWLIVPMGNTALWALTGKAGPPWQRRVRGRSVPGIVAHRGSIYSYRRPTHAGSDAVKVIPTIHPAATFRTPRWAYRIRRDWTRIAGDLTFRELRLPVRDHQIRPTLGDVWDFVADATVRHAHDLDMILAIDVETPRKTCLVAVSRATKSGKLSASRWKRVRGAPRITCVGFSFAAHYSMTIPTEGWGSPEEHADAWLAIRTLCALDCDKAMQNGLFDAWWLARAGCPVRHYVWDPRWMSHSVDPLDDHDLGYLGSLDTREPYWKSDVKGFDDPENVEAYDSLDTFYRYNGKDVAVTRELVDVWRTRVSPEYREGYVACYGPLLRMMLHGMRFDERGAAVFRAWLASQCATIRGRLAAVTSASLFGPKDVSSKKLAEYLYDTLGLPKQYHTVKDSRGGEKRRALTANEVTVRKLALRYPGVLGDLREAEAAQDDGDAARDAIETMTGVAPLILTYRRLAVQAKFLKESVVSEDGRVRSQYGWVATRRLSSGKAPDRRGQNLQNVDRALRRMYLADEGCVLVEADLAQAEHRYVLMLMAPFACRVCPTCRGLSSRDETQAYETMMPIVICETCQGVGTIPDAARRAELLWRARARPWENDEHVRTAQKIFHVEQVSAFQREIGKRTNHAGNYGERGKTMSEGLLKDGIVIEEDECQGFLNTRVQAEPEIELWHRDVRRRAMRDRRLDTPFGLVWDLTNERLNDDLFRSCYAMEPQNAPPEIVNRRALVPLSEAVERGEWPNVAVQLQTHDSLGVSVPLAQAYSLARWMVTALEKPITVQGERLTLWVETKVGMSWGTMTSFKQFPTEDEWNAEVAKITR